MTRELYDRILALLRREVKPALGCTEPIAVALAVAKAASLGEGSGISHIDVKVSPNILKNAMGVGIPGTGLTGLPVAVALAAVCGRAEYGLEVLKDADAKDVAKAQQMLNEGKVTVGIADSDKMLYACAECLFENGSRAKAVVADAHDSIVFVSKDGEVLLDAGENGGPSYDEDDGKFLTLTKIYEFAHTISKEDMKLLFDQVTLNSALVDAGLSDEYGLKVGRTIFSPRHKAIFGDSLVMKAMACTAAAADARMSGCPLPAMSNSGSGNQGITVSVPVITAAKEFGSSEEQLLRALTLSNLVAIHIKSYLGKLSALCGCVVASTGSSCGIIMLQGGTTAQMAFAIKNMIGSITGMVCDGAKEGCALKVASGVSCAVQSAVLAMDNISVQPSDGIIDEDVEKCIKNLGKIGAEGMKQTDKLILDIMICK